MVKNERIEILDVLRGIAILGMVFQHILVDLRFVISGINLTLLDNSVLQNIFVFGGVFFIFLSGISSYYSKHNVRRGLLLLGLGALITAVTYLFFRGEVIYFGILHFLGAAILIYALLGKMIRKIPQVVILIGSMLVFVGAYYLYSLNIRIENPLSFLIGFPEWGFYSADYFPIFPYFFAFLGGTGFGWFVFNRKLPQTFYKLNIPGLNVVGRYSLWIYLLHQPIIILILKIAFGQL